jgi:hypothetical protein
LYLRTSQDHLVVDESCFFSLVRLGRVAAGSCTPRSLASIADRSLSWCGPTSCAMTTVIAESTVPLPMTLVIDKEVWWSMSSTGKAVRDEN